MRRYLLLCLLLLPLFASPQQTRIEEQAITHTQAQQWGLTDSEWQRYQQLHQGERGIWSPGLDPLTTLGVETNSDAERQRFAELLAPDYGDLNDPRPVFDWQQAIRQRAIVGCAV